jgi:putative hemolysin
VDARLNLSDFAERTGLRLPPGPYETVGGFLMAALGRLPVIGDEATVPGPGGGWLLRVLTVEGRRVARVAVVPPPVPADPSGAGARPEPGRVGAAARRSPGVEGAQRPSAEASTGRV